MNLLIEAVLHTTNHLESFNSQLKNKYFQSYLKCGRLPRIDIYILTLVNNVIPNIQAEQNEKVNVEQYQQSLMSMPGPRSAKQVSTTTAIGGDEPAAPENPLQTCTVPEADLDMLEYDEKVNNEEEYDSTTVDTSDDKYSCVLKVKASAILADMVMEYVTQDITDPSDDDSDCYWGEDYALHNIDIIEHLSSDMPIECQWPSA